MFLRDFIHKTQPQYSKDVKSCDKFMKAESSEPSQGPMS